jgi:hypothetical protein
MSNYDYHKPEGVKSPQDCIDSVVKIFDGDTENGAFSLAKITWEGTDCIGIRWNVTQREWNDPNKKNGSKKCVGEPNSRGYPTWFILPDDFIESLLSGNSEIALKIKQILENIKKNKK